MAQFAEVVGHAGGDYRILAEQTRQGMQRFWANSLGYCYDVIDGPDGPDPTLRPNQIFAVALPSPTLGPPSFLRPSNRLW